MTHIQISQETGKIFWYSHLLKNFPQFVIHTVKGFSVKFIWNHKRRRISKAVLREKNKFGAVTLTLIKLYYKATVIKTALYWYRNQTQRLMNRIKSSEVNSHTCGQLIYNKGGKNIQWREGSLFNMWFWESWTTICETEIRTFSSNIKKNQNGLMTEM